MSKNPNKGGYVETYFLLASDMLRVNIASRQLITIQKYLLFKNFPKCSKFKLIFSMFVSLFISISTPYIALQLLPESSQALTIWFWRKMFRHCSYSGSSRPATQLKAKSTIIRTTKIEKVSKVIKNRKITT